MYTVYILSNATNRVLYVGVTNNLIRRVYEHRCGLVGGFTKRYKVKKLVYFEQFSDPESAIAREKQLKGGSRARKIQLITAKNPGFADLYEGLL